MRRPVLFVVFLVVQASVWLMAFAYLSPEQYARSRLRYALARQWQVVSFQWRRGTDRYLTEGKDLYETHCATCHGLAGEGGKGPSLDANPTGITEQQLAELINIGAIGMPPFERVLDPEQVMQVVAYVSNLVDATPVATLAGDASRGELLYQTRGECHSCHDSGRDAGGIAPDLSNVGLRRGPAYLRRKLLEPGKELDKRYRPVRLVTKSGETVTGTTLNEDTFSVQIRALDGAIHSFHRSELVTLHVELETSLMPSYRQVFGDDELDDLVAYLTTLRRGR